MFQNQEKMTEGDLTAQMDQSDKVRELQDKIAHLRAQVLFLVIWLWGTKLRINDLNNSNLVMVVWFDANIFDTRNC